MMLTKSWRGFTKFWLVLQIFAGDFWREGNFLTLWTSIYTKSWYFFPSHFKKFSNIFMTSNYSSDSILKPLS